MQIVVTNTNKKFDKNINILAYGGGGDSSNNIFMNS